MVMQAFQVFCIQIPLLILSNITYMEQNYLTKQVHIITRLDKDTSGFDALCQTRLCHARLDKQLQK